MRVVALALAITLLLGGCMNRPARRDRSDEVSYNRRELPPEQGLFTGCDGVWTVYRNNPERSSEECPPRPDGERATGASPDGVTRGEAPAD